MKKQFKILGIILSAIIIMSAFIGINVSAAGATLIFSKKDVKVGETVTVNVSIDGGEAMFGVSATVSYDSQILQFVSGDGASGSNGSIGIAVPVTNTSKKVISLEFKAVGEGNCVISVRDVLVVYKGDAEVPINGASATMPVKADTPAPSEPEAPSSDANLTSLSLSNGKLSPRFSAKTTNYTATVENAVDKVTVNATAAEGASVSGTGSIALKEGRNKHTITVTAADGTKKTYTITITRLKPDEENTSSDNTSSEEPSDNPDDNPPSGDVLVTYINNESHHVLSEIPEDIKIPGGFSAGKANFNGAEVSVYESPNKEYVLYTLKRDSDGDVKLYTYDSMRDEFIPLPYMDFGGKMYILPKISPEYKAPAGYTRTTANLGNTTADVFCSEDPRMADFCIIYCFVDGKHSYYSYDMVEQTLQRAPYFEAVNAGTDKTSNNGGFIAQFKNMPFAGKTVIITLVIAVLSIIALVVLLVMRFMNSRDFNEDDVLFDSDLEFDEVNYTDASSLKYEIDSADSDAIDTDDESEEDDVNESEDLNEETPSSEENKK